MRRIIGITALVAALLLAFSCTTGSRSAPGGDLSEVPRVEIDSLELFLSVETDPIRQPLALELLPDRRLAVLDAGLNEILVFQSGGTLAFRFGGQGRGPGEFVAPRGLFITDSAISVNDVGVMKMKQFNHEGEFLQSYLTERESFFGFVAPGGGQDYYSVANGKNGKLIRYHDTRHDTAVYFGEAPAADPPPVNDSEAFHASATAGKVPDAIKNDLLMDFYGDQLYAYLKGTSHLRKYVDKKLQWDRELALPVNEKIFRNFVDDVTEGPSAGFGVLRYVNDIEATADYVYLLWNGTPDEPQQIVRVSEEGDIQQIFRLAGSGEGVHFSSISVDEANNRMYLAYSPAGEIYTASIPD